MSVFLELSEFEQLRTLKAAEQEMADKKTAMDLVGVVYGPNSMNADHPKALASHKAETAYINLCIESFNSEYQSVRTKAGEKTIVRDKIIAEIEARGNTSTLHEALYFLSLGQVRSKGLSIIFRDGTIGSLDVLHRLGDLLNPLKEVFGDKAGSLLSDKGTVGLKRLTEKRGLPEGIGSGPFPYK